MAARARSSSRPGRLGRLLSVGRREWQDFLRAQAALLRATIVVRTRPRGRLVRTIPSERGVDGPSPAPPRDGSSDPGRMARAVEIATGVRRAARYSPLRPTCLVRAIALQRLLDRAGIEEASVQVGVRREEGVFSAHAWVTYGGQIVGEPRSAVDTFQPLQELVVGR